MQAVSQPDLAVPTRGSTSRFWPWVVAATALGLVIRLAYIFGPARHRPLGGDPAYYHGLARVIAEGHWFIEPLEYVVTGKHVPTATHPPLYPLVLAVFTKFGVGTALGQRVVTSLIGITVIPLAALAAKRLMGTQAGIVVAVLAAINPAFWMNDVNVLSEALLAPLIAAIILVAISAVPKSVPLRTALLGALIGLATLTRGVAAPASVARGTRRVAPSGRPAKPGREHRHRDGRDDRRARAVDGLQPLALRQAGVHLEQLRRHAGLGEL